MQETENTTNALVASLKEKYGRVNHLTTEDGKECYIKDPLSDLKVVKMAMGCLEDSDETGFAQVIMANCFIQGDEELKREERYLNGFVDILKDILEAPDPEVVRDGNRFIITIGEDSLPVKPADRELVKIAKKKNPKQRPLETEQALLELISLDKEKLDKIKTNTRQYVGFLMATREAKEKVVMAVKKL